MPITFSITAISGSYSDIAVDYYEKTFIYLIGIFTLRASQSHYNGFVVAHSQ
jgi:hypothetical protein